MEFFSSCYAPDIMCELSYNNLTLRNFVERRYPKGSDHNVVSKGGGKQNKQKIRTLQGSSDAA